MQSRFCLSWSSPIWLIQISFLLFPLIVRPTFAESDNRPAKIKAALVYYVMKFVEWPYNNNSNQDIKFCTIGTDPVLEEIRELLSLKQVKKMPIKFVAISLESLTLARTCQVIYFSNDSDSKTKEQINKAIENEAAILTICEGIKDYSPNCMVQIFEDKNKAKLSIDKNSKTGSLLLISSELLELSVIPTPKT
jgi:YfiR/HmsC-like